MSEEFVTRAPKEYPSISVDITKMEIDDNNQDDSFEENSAHHCMIQQFKYEMVERQRLEVERDKKRKIKLLLTQELVEKQAKTAETRREVEKFLVASAKLRSFIETQH
ncbi:194_t:CDS:2 [Ambispora gerdemannii]|uniref:194_t:CDS:1 n=1 Tax=Ambispora gerdemannii TaxID=144530 RepID=A0A9N8Z582_9GLOM|nr:194_t:CDS:2 [Ambispora gerdemannii]